MTEASKLERALVGIVRALEARGKRFALVGGLAVSVRSEVRFTRDVELAVAVVDDAEAEALIRDLMSDGYRAVATVEHEVQRRLSSVRLVGPEGLKIDLLFASSGLEQEIIGRATAVTMSDAGLIPVARSEELLAMKVLSMTATRLQDRLDAQRLVQMSPELDVKDVRENLERITARGFHREQRPQEKLDALLAEISSPD